MWKQEVKSKRSCVLLFTWLVVHVSVGPSAIHGWKSIERPFQDRPQGAVGSPGRPTLACVGRKVETDDGPYTFGALRDVWVLGVRGLRVRITSRLPRGDGALPIAVEVPKRTFDVDAPVVKSPGTFWVLRVPGLVKGRKRRLRFGSTRLPSLVPSSGPRRAEPVSRDRVPGRTLTPLIDLAWFGKDWRRPFSSSPRPPLEGLPSPFYPSGPVLTGAM